MLVTATAPTGWLAGWLAALLRMLRIQDESDDDDAVFLNDRRRMRVPDTRSRISSTRANCVVYSNAGRTRSARLPDCCCESIPVCGTVSRFSVDSGMLIVSHVLSPHKVRVAVVKVASL